MAVDPPGSWTAYPSLLSSLTEDQQAQLEKAASAHYCGRYQEADAIFAWELLPLHKIPIVALQHADMLTASGRERERINVIRTAQSSLDLDREDSQPLDLLLQLMLAEAEFFALGLLPKVSELLQRVRSLFLDSDVQGLSNLQLRLAATYYQFIDTLKEETNMVNEADNMIFEDLAVTHFASRLDELWAIYRALKTERRWRHAPVLMVMLLKYAPQGPKRQEAVGEAAKLWETLSTADHPGIKFRSVSLRNALAALWPPHLADFTRAENIQLLTQLAGPGFATWQDFCPVTASNWARLKAIQGADRPENLMTSLTKLAEEAEGRSDFLVADQLYRAARDTNHRWLNGITDDDASRPAALELLRRLQEAYIVFQETRVGSAFFYASGIVDLLTTLSAQLRDYTAVTDLVGRFEVSHPDLGIPRPLERIYDVASGAASALGQHDKLAHYAKQQERWQALCPLYDASGNFADKTVLDPVLAMHWIYGDHRRRGDMVTAGDNAVRIMLRWAAYEWDEGLLSTEEVRALFDPGLVDMPRQDVSTYLRHPNLKYTDVATKLLGTFEEPVDSTSFLNSYQRLLKWAQAPDRRPSLGARLLAMKVFVQSRIRRFGGYLQKRNPDGATSEQNAVYESERAKVLEIEQLEAHADNKFVDSTRARREAIHTLLLKCYQPKAEARKAVPESEIAARIEDAQSLVTVYENRGDLLRQYDATTSLIRLHWQRHLLYEHTPPEVVLEPAEQAEDLFCKVRDLLLSKDPSDNLVARAMMPENFPYNEHYRYALMASFLAYKRSRERSDREATEEAQYEMEVFLHSFLSWALRSKGRGFADVLSMEAGVAKSIEAATEPLPAGTQTHADPKPGGEDAASNVSPGARNPEVATKLEHLSVTSGGSPFRGATVTAAEIAEMLNALPEGVVVVDYVDLPYSPEDAKRLAVLHRRGQRPLFAPIIPVNIPGQVIGWVHSNLITDEMPLDGSGGTEKLAALAGLVDFVEKEEFLVKEGETLVLCPTGILNRVPLHAVPVGGRPLIERNPVVYCQSLTILHWLWKKSTGNTAFPADTRLKATVINPMPPNWPSEDGHGVGDPVMSTPGVRKLASRLGASYHGGYPVNRTRVLSAITGSHILHYHGHVEYNPNSALDSVMCLSAASLGFPFSKHTRPESISARQLFGVRLAAPALATILGCRSGVAAVSSTDDVLGMPTALFFAGAGAVVSTLWKILDEDGEAFATEFYAALERNGHNSGDGPLAGMVDLAAAMRDAILALRSRAEEELKAPYHWAAFTLNGFHFIRLPSLSQPATSSPSDL